MSRDSSSPSAGSDLYADLGLKSGGVISLPRREKEKLIKKAYLEKSRARSAHRPNNLAEAQKACDGAAKVKAAYNILSKVETRWKYEQEVKAEQTRRDIAAEFEAGYETSGSPTVEQDGGQAQQGKRKRDADEDQQENSDGSDTGVVVISSPTAKKPRVMLPTPGSDEGQKGESPTKSLQPVSNEDDDVVFVRSDRIRRQILPPPITIPEMMIDLTQNGSEEDVSPSIARERQKLAGRAPPTPTQYDRAHYGTLEGFTADFRKYALTKDKNPTSKNLQEWARKVFRVHKNRYRDRDKQIVKKLKPILGEDKRVIEYVYDSFLRDMKRMTPRMAECLGELDRTNPYFEDQVDRTQMEAARAGILAIAKDAEKCLDAIKGLGDKMKNENGELPPEADTLQWQQATMTELYPISDEVERLLKSEVRLAEVKESLERVKAAMCTVPSKKEKHWRDQATLEQHNLDQNSWIVTQYQLMLNDWL
ncbi:hypothetical protein SCUP234_02048 [Seiridium cupressi]